MVPVSAHTVGGLPQQMPQRAARSPGKRLAAMQATFRRSSDGGVRTLAALHQAWLAASDGLPAGGRWDVAHVRIGRGCRQGADRAGALDEDVGLATDPAALHARR